MRERGYSNYEWLRSQALDQATLDFIDMRQGDEQTFLEKGIASKGDEGYILKFKQGSFYTTRTTGPSISHVFVQIFKNKEHRAIEGFRPTHSKVIVDVGANEGFYAHSLASQTDATIYSIEPNPIAYDLLCRNIELNHLKNVIPLNYAVWSSKKESEMSIIPQVTSVGTMSLIPTSYMHEAMDRVKKVPVQTITLVDLVEMYNIEHIDLLKIDVEGAELEVFKGALPILNMVDRIVLEYHSQDIRHEVTELLAEWGYDMQYHEADRKDFGDLYFVKRELLPVSKDVLSNQAKNSAVDLHIERLV